MKTNDVSEEQISEMSERFKKRCNKNKKSMGHSKSMKKKFEPDWFDEMVKEMEDYFNNTPKEKILEDLKKSGYDFYQKHGINFIDYSILDDEKNKKKSDVL
jgi:hypothetical protein